MASIDTRHETEQKTFDNPDEVREFPNGRAEILHVGGGEVGRATFEPGWRWSNDVRPIAGTDSCMARHTGYVVAGRMGIRMDDGTERELGPGDAMYCDPGHDAWVIGEDPCIMLDFT